MEKKHSTTLFDVISDIESDAAPIQEVKYTLVLFAEALRNAVEWLNPAEPYTVELFTKRFELLSAMLDMIQRELGQHDTALQADIANAYRVQAAQQRNTIG